MPVLTLTADRLREIVTYDPETGRFTMLVRARRKRIGDEAGFVNEGGYRRITIDGRMYYTNVLAWLYMTGSPPPAGLEVDHRDNDPGNDRWRNLRLATRAQNVANRRRPRKYLKGAHPNGNGWTSFIQSNKVRRYLGSFKTERDAHAAYCAAAIELHGEFANFS